MRILLLLPCKDINFCRLVNKQWNNTIQYIQPNQWKSLFRKRIGWIEEPVNPKFDWMKALLQAEISVPEIEAICRWNNIKLKIVAPWVERSSIIDVIDTSIFIGMTLRAWLE